MSSLEGKKLLITGVINREKIAFEVELKAQAAGAEIVITGFGRANRMNDRSAAKLVHAFAEATVPKVTVVLRKAFGGAFIAMNARDLGADYVFAWPQAQLGVMGAKQAVGIVNRRAIAAAEDPVAARDAFASDYADEHLSAANAAAEGYVDEVILPDDTRRRLTEALTTLDAIAHPATGVRNIPL